MYERTQEKMVSQKNIILTITLLLILFLDVISYCLFCMCFHLLFAICVFLLCSCAAIWLLFQHIRNHVSRVHSIAANIYIVTIYGTCNAIAHVKSSVLSH